MRPETPLRAIVRSSTIGSAPTTRADRHNSSSAGIKRRTRLSLVGFWLGVQPQSGVGPGARRPQRDDLASPRECRRNQQDENNDAARPCQAQPKRWSGGGRVCRESIHRGSAHRTDHLGVPGFWRWGRGLRRRRRRRCLGLHHRRWRKWLWFRRFWGCHCRPLAIASRTPDDAPGRHQLVGNVVTRRAGRADNAHTCAWWSRTSFEAMAAFRTGWQ
jgi:hypothetical protein